MSSPRCPKCGYDPNLVVTYSYRFILRLEAKSLNVFRSKASRWDSYYRGYRTKVRNAIAEPRDGKHARRATGKRRATITRRYVRKQRPFDFDNLAGGLKPVVDGLVESGLLLDDRPDAVELYYDQAPTNQPLGFIEIQLEDVTWPVDEVPSGV